MMALPQSKSVRGSEFLQAAADGDVNLYAAVGGQGNTEYYFDELRILYAKDSSVVQDLVKQINDQLQGLCQDKRATKCFARGSIQVLEWLESPLNTPKTQSLISAPVSLPLIGLLTLTRYAATCEKFGLTPGQLRAVLRGITGHSQGIVAAAVIASADSWADYFQLTQEAITVLFWIGVRSQEWSNPEALASIMIAESIKHNEGSPTPMLSINGLGKQIVAKHLTAINSFLPEDEQPTISLINTPENIVVSGPPQSLCGLNARLRTFNVARDLDQSKVPFDKRKVPFSHRFLPITAPFHSHYLKDAYDTVVKDVHSITLSPSRLAIPLYATDSGKDLRSTEYFNLIPQLVRMILLDVVDWPRAIAFPGATHVLDFGPGGPSGIGALINQIKQGGGVRTILVNDQSTNDSSFGNMSELFTSHRNRIQHETPWSDFGPRLMRDSSGKIHLDTKFSRLLALPPLMVAGMTPTTVHSDFVAATMNAGYHVELAGGGYLNAVEMESAITQIVDSVPPGRGITCNLIYVSPRAIAWQIPMIQSLVARGVNIEGLTIGAGVPSADVANEYIRTLGLKHVAFKPGSLNGIQSVINIAKANPSFPVILQWTGGRGGGHHSAEDFHQPIIETYRNIRSAKNLILLAGSGFGGASDTYPYLTGNWSLKFQLRPMPFDGILIGSRVMTAKEAHTSQPAKAEIANAAGLDDNTWTQTYTGKAGGIISVVSEMGQPIHIIATRGALFWAEMDQRIFSLPRDKRTTELENNRCYIIERLNKDFQKPWFPKTSAGSLAELTDMTYLEVFQRLVELTYIGRTPGRWIHDSWRLLTQDFFLRIEQRFSSAIHTSLLSCSNGMVEPHELANMLHETYPDCGTDLIKAEDSAYFLSICKRPKQKPVPFVPCLDNDFETWFKKDSLWQSEDIEAVIGQDVGRVCILQGPVAVRHSHTVDEPIKDILESITDQHIKWLIRDRYNGSEEQIPTDQYFSNLSSLSPALATTEIGMSQAVEKESFTLHAAGEIDPSRWFKAIGGNLTSWRHAAFNSEFLIAGKQRQDNPIRLVFWPKTGLHVSVFHPHNPPTSNVRLYEDGAQGRVEKARIELLDQGLIRLSLTETRSGQTPMILPLYFSFHPEAGYSLVREVMTDRIQRTKEFYYRLWFGEDLQATHAAITDVFDGGKVTLDRDALHIFSIAVGKAMPIESRGSAIDIPMDFYMVVAWKALMKPIFLDQIGGDILRLVHLSNSFKIVPGAKPLKEGDEVESKSKITMLMNNDSGRVVEVQALLYREGAPVVEITSQFHYRGTYLDFTHTFKRKVETVMELRLPDTQALTLLLTKDWFQRENTELNLARRTLTFELETTVRYATKSRWDRLEVTGQVCALDPLGRSVRVGSVSLNSKDAVGNPVIDYLERNGKPEEIRYDLVNPIHLHGTSPTLLSIVAPKSNRVYSDASGDHNPIHTSDLFARLAGLPGTITHGMYISAAVRGLLEDHVAENRIDRCRSFSCSFVGMTLPGDELEVSFEHVAMISGRKVIKVSVVNTTSGAQVLQGQAEVEQPSTSYIFTGQGSQEKGMGMDLYESSPVAKLVWDIADKSLMEKYGFSILNIVRHNPKELVIHFGGNVGRKRLQNYMSMAIDTLQTDGTMELEPILKELRDDSTLYTFRSPQGLLYSTQFAQLALTLFGKAAFEDMRTRGLIQEGGSFAGHSLGEYVALASMAEFTPFNDLLPIVFYRGLAMQNVMARDAEGRTEYSMCAVNPSRISRVFTERTLETIVDTVCQRSNRLLEIVNYNVAEQQYVCAGHVQALYCLRQILESISTADFSSVVLQDIPKEKLPSSPLEAIIVRCIDVALGKQLPFELIAGVGYTPLRGIDIPFHSTFLRPGVGPFRNYIKDTIKEEDVQPSKMINKYIPNLTARSFNITKEYIEECYELTKSPKLKIILDQWTPDITV